MGGSKGKGRVLGKGEDPGERGGSRGKGRVQSESLGGLRLAGLIEEQGRDMRKRKCPPCHHTGPQGNPGLRLFLGSPRGDREPSARAGGSLCSRG